VDITPSVISSELADAALASPELSSALALANWIGDGKEVTASGVLRPAAAAEACAVLGIDLPRGKVRSASDVPELEHAWLVAHAAGLITIDGKHVRGPGFEDVTADAGLVLRSALRALAADLGLPDEPCGHCLTVLAAFADAEGPVAPMDVMEVIRQAFPVTDDPDVDPAELEEDAAHALAGLDKLVAFGAIDAMDDPDDQRARLTPLGRMLADSLFAAMAPDPAADAGTVVQTVGAYTPPVGMIIARPWLAARTPADAVREVLAYAEHADARLRVTAVGFATGIGPEAAEAWREYAQVPGFGAYAKGWLVLAGENVRLSAREQAWLAADAFIARVAPLPPFMLPMLLSDMSAGELAAFLRELRDSGHPDAEWLLQTASAVGIRAPRPRSFSATTGVCQLKITLQEVSDPTVWRRVLVPAGVSWDKLAAIIERAMGWDGSHEHTFSYGRLAAPGDELVYSYDLAAGWQHEIVLEEIDQNERGVTQPSCLAGNGACPPEDCGGPWGYQELKETIADPVHEDYQSLLDWLGLESGDQFDPAAFSVDEVNARLDGLRSVPQPARTVVRVQARAGKRRAGRRGRR
jgi:hypothetical protein